MLTRFSGVHAVPFRRTRTNAKGQFRLCVPIGNCTYDLYASWRKGEKTLSNNRPAKAEVGDGPLDGIEIMIRAGN